MDNNTEYNGPIHGKVKLRPSAFEASSNGGDLVPAPGYSTADINSDNFGIEGGIGDAAGINSKLAADYPPINSNESPNNGRNLYEPLRIAFVHKFSGPHVDVQEYMGYQGSIIMRAEEFLRVRIKYDADDNVFSPYTCATITGVCFPYGKTSKGIIHPDINKVKSVMFRDKFTFDLVHPNIDEGPNLYNYDPANPTVSTPGAAFYSPLYSSSLINMNSYQDAYENPLNQLGVDNREFQLITNAGSGINSLYGGYGTSTAKSVTVQSIHPELSRGETSSFLGPNSYTTNPSTAIAGGYGWGGTLENIQHKIQGETDGTFASFKMIAQRGCIIKGLIELF